MYASFSDKLRYLYVTCILFLFFLTSPATLVSQDNHLRFKHITTRQGLSNSIVNCIVQDSKGYLWIGTNDGLNKYNGYNFITYKKNPDDPNSICSNTIYNVFEDTKGRLWIGTYDGIALFDYASENFTNYRSDPEKPKSLSNNIASVVIEDSIGNFWVKTYGGGINYFNPETEEFIHFNHQENNPNSIASDKIFTMRRDAKGNIWIGTGMGLSKMYRDKNNTVNFDNFLIYPDKPEQNTVWEICTAPQNEVWAGMLGYGLWIFDKNTETFEKKPTERNNENIYYIYSDNEKNMWLGTMSGLQKHNFQTDSFIVYRSEPQDPYSISSNVVWTLAQDRMGLLWVGTSNGLNILDPSFRQFVHFRKDPTNENTLSSNMINKIYQEENGTLWVGSDLGLNKIDIEKNHFTKFKADNENDNSLSHNFVYDIYKDEYGIFWIATWGGGLNIFDPESGNFHIYKNIPNDSNSLVNNHIRDIYRDKQGNMWLGTLYGLSRVFFERNDKLPEITKFVTYGHNPDDPKSLAHNFAYYIFEDSRNNFWVGTRSGGLDLFDRQTKTFKHFKYEQDNPNSLSNNRILSLFEDSRNTLWVGTFGGLNKFDRKNQSFTRYRLTDGLPNEVICGILEDDHYNLWISTNSGISKFDPENIVFDNFDKLDGLQDNEFNPFAYFKNEDGQMFFGGINGFNMFHPDSIVKNRKKAPVVITNFQILNKTVNIGEKIHGKVILTKHISQTKHITLSYKDYIFSFEFASMDFTCPQKNRYAYKMVGLDEEWIYTGASRRFATYTNLDAGDYTFMVKATNSDGVWNNEPATITLTILPPFWETWWFRALIIFVVLGSVYLWYRSRINRIKKQKEELERQVKERTAEIRQKNVALSEQKKQIEAAYQNVKMLSEIGKEITSNLAVETIVDTVYENINQLMDASIFGIGIYNSIDNAILFSGTKEDGETLPVFSYSLDDEERIAVKCYKNQKSILISDFKQEQKTKPVAGKSPKSIIYLPLNLKDKRIGVITVQSFSADAYSENHLNIVSNLAVYTAIALDNADAYQQIEDYAGNLREANVQLEEQQEEIQQQAEELSAQAEALQATNTALQREKEYTLGSIRYAKTIQNAILPALGDFEKFFESFVIFREKDIVSGDFYWFSHIEEANSRDDKIFIVVVDCTGHGVPGAFMSMIGNRLLNSIVNEQAIYDPGTILAEMDKRIKKALRQKETDNKDGMDVCICLLENDGIDKFKLTYSGAKRPLIFFNKDGEKVELIKGDRKSIGGVATKVKIAKFTNHRINVSQGDVLYLTTDGMIDQNSPDRKRFGTPKFLKIIQTVATQNMTGQKQYIEDELDKHQAHEEQRDDITIVGLKIK